MISAALHLRMVLWLIYWKIAINGYLVASGHKQICRIIKLRTVVAYMPILPKERDLCFSNMYYLPNNAKFIKVRSIFKYGIYLSSFLNITSFKQYMFMFYYCCITTYTQKIRLLNNVFFRRTGLTM